MDDDKTQKEDVPTANRIVLSLLRKGIANAITVREIISLTGYKNQEVRRLVQELVVTYKYKIGTSNESGRQGYYLIETEDERKATIRNLRGRMKHLYKRVKSLRDGDLENE